MTPEVHGGGVLGEKVEGPRRTLDTFDLPPQTREVTYFSDEVMSYCPITGQPDWYSVNIYLEHARLGIESKSLKLYLQSFADKKEGQFCEEFAATIAKDVQTATSAIVEVVLEQKPRGGVSITATAKSSTIAP